MFKNTPGSPSQQKGLYFENLALNYLKKQGLILLQRNYHCRFGEIDLVMQDATGIVFIEIRFRGNIDYGSAFDSVNRYKQEKIIRTARLYLLQHGLYEQVPTRFDVVSATKQNGKTSLHWIRNAFQA